MSKYYLISQIYARCLKIDSEHVHYYLLAPNYSKALYPLDLNNKVEKCNGKKLCFSSKYSLIGYDLVYKFFNSIELQYHDIYFEDFIDTMKKLTEDSDCVYESKIATSLKDIIS